MCLGLPSGDPRPQGKSGREVVLKPDCGSERGGQGGRTGLPLPLVTGSEVVALRLVEETREQRGFGVCLGFSSGWAGSEMVSEVHGFVAGHQASRGVAWSGLHDSLVVED